MQALKLFKVVVLIHVNWGAVGQLDHTNAVVGQGCDGVADGLVQFVVATARCVLEASEPEAADAGIFQHCQCHHIAGGAFRCVVHRCQGEAGAGEGITSLAVRDHIGEVDLAVVVVCGAEAPGAVVVVAGNPTSSHHAGDREFRANVAIAVASEQFRLIDGVNHILSTVCQYNRITNEGGNVVAGHHRDRCISGNAVAAITHLVVHDYFAAVFIRGCEGPGAVLVVSDGSCGGIHVEIRNTQVVAFAVDEAGEQLTFCNREAGLFLNEAQDWLID